MTTVTIETSGDGPLAPFDAVWDAVATLPTPARAMFALACAERLARAAGRDDELSEALEAGWAAADGQPADLAPLRSELEDRDDLDDDDPAATYFALGAAAGSVKDCRAAANRAMDAAFARVTYPAGATTFRPLADDAAEPPVQDELAWQRAAATRLADDGPTDDVRAWLRR